jgi:hypothetical protein
VNTVARIQQYMEAHKMCEFCDGEGKVCHKCGNSRRKCECVVEDPYREIGLSSRGDYMEGYDPVICDECNGEGQ